MSSIALLEVGQNKTTTVHNRSCEKQKASRTSLSKGQFLKGFQCLGQIFTCRTTACYKQLD
jgi:hypothetical protein